MQIQDKQFSQAFDVAGNVKSPNKCICIQTVPQHSYPPEYNPFDRPVDEVVVPFSQLHKGDDKIARTGHIMQIYNKNIKTNWRQQQIPNCGRREDETDARAVRPNSLARCIE